MTAQGTSASPSAGLVTDYQLAYTEGASSNRSLLASITPCDGSGTCLPATTFTYTQGTTIAGDGTSGTPSFGGSSFASVPTFVLGDFAGAGRTSVLVTGPGTTATTTVWLNQGGGQYTQIPLGVWAPGGNQCSSKPVTGDFNGDGRTDIYWDCGDGSGYLWLSNGDGTFQGVNLGQSQYGTHEVSPIATQIVQAGLSYQVTALDLNGDGRTDLILSSNYIQWNGNNTYQTWISGVDGSGNFQFVQGSQTWPSGVSLAVNATASLLVGDFQGHGRSDLFITNAGNMQNGSYFLLAGNGDGSFNLKSPLSGVDSVAPSGNNYWAPAVGYFGSDGNAGILWLLMSASGSTGSGKIWLGHSEAAFEVHTFSFTAGLQPSLGDFNATGRTDIFWTSATNTNSTLWLANGDGTFRTSGSGAGSVNLSTIPTTSKPYVADFSGDGKADVIWLGESGSAIQATSWSSDGVPTDLLASVTTGLNSKTNLSYLPLTSSSVYTKGGGAVYPIVDLQSPLEVVNKVVADTGLGNGTTHFVNFTYSAAKLELDGRGLLGFTGRTITDPAQSGGTENVTSAVTYGTAWPTTGLVNSSTATTDSVQTSNTQNTYQYPSPGSATMASGATALGYSLPELYTSAVSTQDLNHQSMGTTTTTYTYDAYANPTLIKTVIQDPTMSGTPLTGKSETRSTANSYTNDATVNWYIGRLVCTQTTDTSIYGATQVRTSAASYDGLGRLQATYIEPTSIQGGSNCVSKDTAHPNLNVATQITRDGYGNVQETVSTGADGSPTRALKYTYGDGENRFPTVKVVTSTQTSPAPPLLTSNYTYNPGHGTVLTAQAPDGQTTTYTYAGFGRPGTIVGPDGSTTTFTYGYCSGSCGGWQGEVTSVYTGVNPNNPSDTAPAAPSKTDYYDSLNRPFATYTNSLASSPAQVYSEIYYKYNANYDLTSTVGPGLSTGVGPNPPTSFGYDDLHRRTSVTYSDSSSDTIAYNGLETTKTNSVGAATTQITHRNGDLVQTLDAYQNATAYQDGPLGTLVKVTDQASHATSYSFDVRGHLLTETRPDSGTTTMTYNSFDQLATRLSAKAAAAGQAAAQYNYDPIGRLLSRLETDMTSYWQWDAPGCTGLLYQTSAANPTGGTATIPGGVNTVYGYDSYCRPATMKNSFGGGTPYTTTTNYDNYGRYVGTQYPDTFQTQWSYSSTGYASEIQGNLPGAGTGYQLAWQLGAIDAAGHETSYSYGNNMATTDSYDGYGRLQSETVGTGSSNLVNTSYGWDKVSVGNLLSHTEAGTNLGSGITSVNDTYQYDSLNEITSDVVTQNGSTQIADETYGYVLNSTTGNPDGTYRIASKSNVGTYAYTNANHPNTVSGITGTLNGNPGYDADGAMTVGFNGRTMTWTSFDMPATITQGGTTTTFYYGPNHRRVEQVVAGSGGTTTINYINDAHATIEQSTTGGTMRWRDYVASPYAMVASAYGVNSGTYAWLFTTSDQATSITTTTTGGGAASTCQSYESFGKRRFCNGAEDPTNTIKTTSALTRGYVDQEELDAPQFVDLNARLYDPQTGMFISPDPAGLKGGPAPYGYVGNNPTTYRDPSGLDCVDGNGVCVNALYTPFSEVLATLGGGQAAGINLSLSSVSFANYGPTSKLTTQSDKTTPDDAKTPGTGDNPITPSSAADGTSEDGTVNGGSTSNDGCTPGVLCIPVISHHYDPPVAFAPLPPVTFIEPPAVQIAVPIPAPKPAQPAARPPQAQNGCPSGTEEDLGRFLVKQGNFVTRAGAIVGTTGLMIDAIPTPPTWISGSVAAGVGGVGVVAGLGISGAGIAVLEDAGDSRGAFQAGVAAVVGAGLEPDSMGLLPKDPADSAAEGTTNYFFGPSHCPNS